MKSLLIKIGNTENIACYVEELNIASNKELEEFRAIMTKAIHEALDKKLPQKLCKDGEKLEIVFRVNEDKHLHY
ncbi:hypothetical protein [Cysteiniphilum marinum]|uniref:hypothetical protein n=1 Tax=Cysteiniphilum marinum TaxID=2774191 RepID=UPI00193A7640|nr:hypothetical protein [Cysteiniphilum marinum]